MRRSFWKYFIGFIVIVPALVIVAVYLFFQFSPLVSRLQVEITLAEHGAIEGIVAVDAFVHRIENTYRIPSAGQVRWNVHEGQRVARNQKLADVLVTEEDHSLVLQQQLINMRLDALSKGGDLSTFSSEALGEIEQHMKHLLSEIGFNVKNRQFELAFQNQHLLNEVTAQRQLISVHQQLPEMSREELENQKVAIKDRLNNITHEIRAENAGYFALGSDGWENVMELHPDEEGVASVIKLMGTLVNGTYQNTDERYFRIISDHRWRMVLPLSQNIAGNYSRGQRILLRIAETDHEVRGRIVEMFPSDQGYEVILLVELDRYFDDWQNTRVYRMNVIYQRQEGLLVPVTAVMNEPDGSKSIFIIDVNGFTVKRQVLELTRNESFAVLKEGPITVQGVDLEANEQQVRSIRQFDEVIANPETVSEGQKVR